MFYNSKENCFVKPANLKIGICYAMMSPTASNLHEQSNWKLATKTCRSQKKIKINLILTTTFYMEQIDNLL